MPNAAYGELYGPVHLPRDCYCGDGGPALPTTLILSHKRTCSSCSAQIQSLGQIDQLWAWWKDQINWGALPCAFDAFSHCPMQPLSAEFIVLSRDKVISLNIGAVSGFTDGFRFDDKLGSGYVAWFHWVSEPLYFKRKSMLSLVWLTNYPREDCVEQISTYSWIAR